MSKEKKSDPPKEKKSDPPKLRRNVPIVRRLKPPRIFDGVQPFDPDDPYDRIEAERENQKLRAAQEAEERKNKLRELELQHKRDQAEAESLIKRLGIQANAKYLSNSEAEIILRIAKSHPDQWPLRRRLLGERLAAREQSGQIPLYPAWTDDEKTEHRWLRECIRHHRRRGAFE